MTSVLLVSDNFILLIVRSNIQAFDRNVYFSLYCRNMFKYILLLCIISNTICEVPPVGGDLGELIDSVFGKEGDYQPINNEGNPNPINNGNQPIDNGGNNGFPVSNGENVNFNFCQFANVNFGCNEN